MGLDACRRDEGIRGAAEVEEEGMAGGQEEYVEVVWTSGGLGRGRKNYFVAGVFPVDKGNGAVEKGGNSGGGRKQWRREVSDRESEGGSG